MCMRPCGPVRHHRGSRRKTVKPVTETSVIYPTESTITLTRDGRIKSGSHVIGQWTKDEIYEGGFHFRPIYSGHGKVCYTASIPGKEPVICTRKKDLYPEIARVCRGGVSLKE